MSTPKKRITRRSHNSTHQKPVEKNRFLDLPFDVITEVFEYLEPVDLLHLARTTKGSRTFLLDRYRSGHVWKTAVSNVPGLPPCPGHLSQPAYAHLTFDPVCHGCFKSCDTIEWELRMRCCPGCHSKLYVPPTLSTSS
ncbi:hypothetical protein L210DRAFT_3406158 [Boletus edulis BED1]|uniref:F-box domain-containing protein n=1 Tax=Boletus edulis BED1 TaxID=1328754 RepID=A0AAD4GD59_BOLED|nr:hypothetical protein L210DRAFT_3428785 [Boletus edulis BED1]KAF8437232.1 hypothetical protein L210DRAFT_3406158 [Boletus edulis BED1]